MPDSGARNGSRRLESGTTPLAQDRVAKLSSIESTFLAARDNYARAIYFAEQARADLVLDPRNADIKRQNVSARDAARTAYDSYSGARTDFMTAVEQLGRSGYDVHAFSYSHYLASTEVTSKDVVRRDASIAAAAARVNYQETYVDNEPSYGNRW